MFKKTLKSNDFDEIDLQARLQKIRHLNRSIKSFLLSYITPNAGGLFFVEHNTKMNAAMYKKHLKVSMKMTGTEVFMQGGAGKLILLSRGRIFVNVLVDMSGNT